MGLPKCEKCGHDMVITDLDGSPKYDTFTWGHWSLKELEYREILENWDKLSLEDDKSSIRLGKWKMRDQD